MVQGCRAQGPGAQKALTGAVPEMEVGGRPGESEEQSGVEAALLWGSMGIPDAFSGHLRAKW